MTADPIRIFELVRLGFAQRRVLLEPGAQLSLQCGDVSLAGLALDS